MSQDEAALPSPWGMSRPWGLRRVAPAGHDETDIDVQARRGEGHCTQGPPPLNSAEGGPKHVLNTVFTRYLCHDGASLLRSSPEEPGEGSTYRECSRPGAASATSKTDTGSPWPCQC